MSDFTTQLVLNTRFRTSKAADELTMELMDGLGLSTKANVARLAIGRSLSMGALPEESVDVKGREIPASSLFHQEDIHVWIGMIVTHTLTHKNTIINTIDDFRLAVRKHWHRGVHLLIEDWRSEDENYDKFIENLINRRADLPDEAVVCSTEEKEDVTTQKDEAKDISDELLRALWDIGVSAEIKGLTHGPRVTRYKIFLKKIGHFDKLRKGLENLSIILSLQEAIPIINKGDQTKTVFLDIPRPKMTWQHTGIEDLKKWCASAGGDDDKMVVYPGVDIMGNPFALDLSNAPHVLVGGATGQGKSVCLHALILSLTMTHSPSSMKLALIDPKQVEFSVYQGAKFLYNDTVAMGGSEASEFISDIVLEMDKRYEAFKKAGVTNIIEARQKGINMPFIGVFIEELADLLLRDRELENQIVRLAQLARACGIHLVLATQRPDSKTFSGLIRSNVPTRIALTVQKSSESSIILDETGAENLLGAGDMIVKKPGLQTTRVHGVFIKRKDIESELMA